MRQSGRRRYRQRQIKFRCSRRQARRLHLCSQGASQTNFVVEDVAGVANAVVVNAAVVEVVLSDQMAHALSKPTAATASANTTTPSSAAASALPNRT